MLAVCFCASETPSVANKPAAPWPTKDGVLGMQRTIDAFWPSHVSILLARIPAATETISCLVVSTAGAILCTKSPIM